MNNYELKGHQMTGDIVQSVDRNRAFIFVPAIYSDTM